MRKIFLIVILFLIISCSSLDQKTLDLQPGMSKDEVTRHMGSPVNRSFRGSDEAWQYQKIAGFGQCSYVTVWFTEGKLLALTSRRGDSVAGCGLGSREIDWGQMPKPSLDINITTTED